MKTLLNDAIINSINNGVLTVIEPSSPVPLIMGNDEELLYIENGYTEKKSTKVVGYKHGGRGYSVKIMKGFRIRLGGGGTKVKRKTETDRSGGLLFITSERIVWQCQEKPFEYPLSKITAISASNVSINVQVGNKTQEIFLPTADTCEKVFHLTIEKLRKLKRL